MSHYYSRIRGGRGEATRAGHKSTGITASVSTHTAKLDVGMCWNDKEQRDEAWAALTVDGKEVELFNGPVRSEPPAVVVDGDGMAPMMLQFRAVYAQMELVGAESIALEAVVPVMGDGRWSLERIATTQADLFKRWTLHIAHRSGRTAEVELRRRDTFADLRLKIEALS